MDSRRRVLTVLALAAACSFVVMGCAASPPPPGPQLFLPESQTPLFEQGLVLPYDSLPCVPDGGVPQNNCNHHGSSVAELTDGTIAISWFHGEREKSLDSRIVWARKAPESSTFSTPEVLYDDPARAEGNSVLWTQEDGTLHHFFVNIEGNGWSQARMRHMQSKDQGATWTAPDTLSQDDCWMLRYPPVRLSTGELLLPGYLECLATPVFVRSKDNFSTWTLQETWKVEDWVYRHLAQIQPSVIALGETNLAAVMRDGGARKRVIRMTSSNNGKTWTEGLPTGLPNPGAAVAQVRLKDGHVVVVFNNSPTSRAPLSAALSLDHGEHFVAVRDLVVDDCAEDECSYPAVTQSEKDGTLWVSYTHRRKTIGFVHFNERWLQEGGQTANVNCIQDVEVCRGERCYAACPPECPSGSSCVDGACRVACSAGCAEGEACDEGGFCRPTVTSACKP